MSGDTFRVGLAERIDTLSDLIKGIEDDHYPTALDRVQALRMIAETAQSSLPHAVADAQEDGATWSQLGRMLDVSRQAAWERYGPRA